MNTDNARGLGNRSLSLGAVLKEQRGPRTGIPDIEYELGNGDFSSHASDSDDPSDDPSHQRVVMMYDEHGNATPMPMANFYYDSVQADNSPDPDNHQTPPDNHNPRANVPAPFNNPPSSSSSSDSDHNVDINNTAGPNFVADADEYDDFDDEKEEDDGGKEEEQDDEEEEEDEDDRDDDDDPYKNQFMRIEIPATGLKDVSRVKKDLDHDKPHKKSTIRAGLQRAVSTVKIADGTRGRPSASQPLAAKKLSKQMSNRSSGLGRMLSFTRDHSSNSHHGKTDAPAPAASSAPIPPKARSSAPAAAGMLGPASQRARDNAPKPVKRQGLAAVGRMISINKQRPSASASSQPSANSAVSEDLPAPIPDRAPPAEPADRPRRSGTISQSPGAKPAGRASLTQVGRLLSRNRKKPAAADSRPQTDRESESTDRTIDRERRETEVSKQPGGARMGLAKLGRVMSFNRTKQSPADNRDDKNRAQVSPLSTSTVSTSESPAAPEEAPARDRARTSGNLSKKEPSRMKVAARMLSFSKKPGQSSRSRTVLASDDKRERSKRAQSVPPKINNEATGEGQKLDGRGDKFFYSEINSEKVRQSGLLDETHIRVPVIAMAEYSGPVSRTKWYIDGFTLPHNAVRRECIDLYDILTAMARCKGNTDICKDDMDDFEDWWKVASSFFNCYFDMERKVLFPWVDSAGAQDWEVQLALKKMRSMKDKLQEQLQRVDRVWNEKTFKGVGEMFALMYKAVDEFVPRLMNYFADQEVLLPAIVKGYYRLDDRLKMDKDMVGAFLGEFSRREKEIAHHNLILLIRWIGNPRQLRAWIGKNLSSSQRGSYPRWYALYEEEHLSVVKRVRIRAKAGESQ